MTLTHHADGPTFVGVDWGTSSFRLWLMDGQGTLYGQSRGPEGMQHCISAGFAPVLEDHLVRARAPGDLPVLICGMAGARQGWFEAPYANLPARVAGLVKATARLPDSLTGGRDIRILPGLAQHDPIRADVIRGEETQITGLIGMGFEGLFCMPGTHCKWARVEGGQVVSFSSYLTGELFELLSHHSILRHAMPGSGRVLAEHPDFGAAVDAALADPARIMGDLFPIRAAVLLGYRDAEASMARLSGLLIGAEVGRQTCDLSGERVVLVGQDGLGALYADALRRSGLDQVVVDAEEATRKGLLVAAREIWNL